MRMKEEAYLAHYGILRKSGRYPWGSGANPNQRSKTFLDIIEEHKKEGLSEAKIAELYDDKKNGHPFTTSDLRALKSRAVNEVKREQIRTANRLGDKGMSNSEIGRKMGLNESTVRSLREPGRQDKLDILQSTANMLKRQVEEKGFLDVGAYTELDLPIGDNPDTRIGISKDKFNTSLSILKEEGYAVVPVNIMQVGTGEMTRYKVLCKPLPGESWQDTKARAFANRDNIRPISERTSDRGRTFTDFGIQPPLSISSKRVAVKYKEEGGADADGVIFVRPGVPDVNLGKSRYAQVRIQVDDTHFLKGMAIYKDDLPPGVDLMFNTNKANTGNKLDAMKPLKDDKDNPFGAVIKEGGQILDAKGKVSSVMNIVNEEGDWDAWSRNLSRQVLSKQQPELAEAQLNRTFELRKQEFDEIKNLTNPLVRQTLLKTFSEETDSAAVHLKAANLPRQATKVILPSNHVKPTEIFAPTYKDGERVALIRFPHAGTFEIPELTVNNRTTKVREMFGGKKAADIPDAVAIHPKVAERLSGADFDGDTVVVIPNNRGDIKATHALDRLKGFDPQIYHVPEQERITITPAQKQTEMGKVTNLIADMQVKGAQSHEIADAVRHSMVVIDSEKHNLDYKASERDHGIHALKIRYQGVNEKTGQPKGASTLITQATAQARVVRRKEMPAFNKKTGVGDPNVVGGIDKRTGEKRFVETGEHNVKFKDSKTGKAVTKSFRSKEAAEEFVRTEQPNGKIEQRTFKSKKLAETKDAFELVSDHGGHEIEKVYARHSNKLKAMANEARKEMVNTEHIPYNPSSKEVYKHEVASLNSKLNRALKNAPLERQAQVMAQKIVSQRKRANPDMQADEKRKIKGQALKEARLRTGASKTRLGTPESPITDREWDAIQAGAISKDRLGKILANSDIDRIRELATPRQRPVMTTVMTSRAKQMFANGATPSEVSAALGIAVSTLQSALAEEGG